MAEFLDVLGFSFTVTAPIFAILALGVGLMRIGMLSDGFVAVGSRLVFTITLPTLLFLGVSKTRLGEAANLLLIAYAALATVLVYLLLEGLATRLVLPERDRGVVVQGAFRSNLGIIGLAYCVNAYGESGLVAASLYIGLITILVNVLAVVTLSRSLHRSPGIGPIVRGVATNPLIIAIVLGLAVSSLEIALPDIARQSGQYLADLTLPLALLCTGASLDFKSLRQEMTNTLLATLGKLVLFPLLLTVGGIALGFRGVDLGILMLISSSPTAAASYVMVRAMAGNAALAANIVALTTLGSLLTTSLGITVLRGLALM